MKRLLTISDCVERLEGKVSLSLIYQWIKDGLPHYRLGGDGKRGKILVDSEDLDAWVDSCKVGESEL